jgi:hypothetical protein
MALWELDEFQGPQFLGFVRSVPEPNTFLGTRWLPNQTVFDLEFEYIKGVNDKPVMAHVMGWDSEAPIHSRAQAGERVSGELPPIKRKSKVSEKEIIRFLTPRAGVPDVQTAINSVYNLTADLLDSVQARVEWLRMQALSENKVVYNEGGVIFAFVCSRKTSGLLVNNQAMRDLIRGANAPTAVLTTGEIQALFQIYDLPTVVTYDVKVRNENADGTYSEVRPLAENKAFLTTPGGVGKTLWGPTAESRPLLGTNLASQAPGIYAVTYGKEEPPSEWVKAVGVSFPSMPDSHTLAQMKIF